MLNDCCTHEYLTLCHFSPLDQEYKTEEEQRSYSEERRRTLKGAGSNEGEYSVHKFSSVVLLGALICRLLWGDLNEDCQLAQYC
jgi:hypothetical protein